MSRMFTLALLIPIACLARVGHTADWPQYRCDSARSASTAENLPDVLALAWTRQWPTPRPAFAAEIRLQFDATYEPIVLGKTLFVPSMINDSLTALDTDSGQQRWRFFAEAPVRFAPVAWQDRVYFVSDDAHLYCVNAADGRLQWKFCGLPPGCKERKILGHSRLISLWPARGGPVLHDGRIYFAAGIWSGYGVGVYALDAATGKLIWANTDSNHIPRGNMDHGIANEAGLSPQGYLAVVDNKLVVPCGAQLPAFLDLKSGALAPYSMGWGGRNGLPKGTWFVAGAGHYLNHGGDLYDLTRPADEALTAPTGMVFKNQLYPGGFTRLLIDPSNQKDLGAFHMPVFGGGAMFDRSDKGIAAYDLNAVKLEERGAAKLPSYRRNDTYPDKFLARLPELWRWTTTRTPHIQAGHKLYVGESGLVEAVRIPNSPIAPQVVWQAQVVGTPHRMLAADGKLFVVTREGRLYAFAVGAQSAAEPPGSTPPAPATDVWTARTAEILQATQAREGYALVLGAGTGRLAEELLRQSKLTAIVIEPDPQKVDQLRRRFDRYGLYGTRISVHAGDPLTYPLPPYLAHLVVSEDWASLYATAGAGLAPTVFHPLRPYGGTACLALPAAACDAVAGRLSAGPAQGPQVRRVGDWLLLCRAGRLPGAADWSHADADAANTGASAETFLRAPLDLLWFDGPPRWIRTPGATLTRVCGGRVLLKSDKLQAVDVFTGRRLWEVTPPFSHRASDPFVALEDALYVAGGKTCLVLDPQTGRELRRIDPPAELSGDWAKLLADGDCLIGQCDQHLVCLDRHTGRCLWKFAGQRSSLSIAVGGARVYCAELPSKWRGESARDGLHTRAFAQQSGRTLWEIPCGAPVKYCAAADLLLVGNTVYRAGDGSRQAELENPPLPNPKSKQKLIPQPLFVIGDKLLYGTAEEFVTYDLRTGKPLGKPLAWVRRGCTVPRASANFVVTRSRGNAACIDLASQEIIPFWNVRTACSNSLFPADGVLNMPSLTGGCTCNYLPVSQAYVPAASIAGLQP